MILGDCSLLVTLGFRHLASWKGKSKKFPPVRVGSRLGIPESNCECFETCSNTEASMLEKDNSLICFCMASTKPKQELRRLAAG
jgi:hypothetical protein